MIQELVGGPAPVVLPNTFDIKRDELGGEYAVLAFDNPLLVRAASEAASVGWDALEIRTMQLIVAVRSNASLQKRIAELEADLNRLDAWRM